MLVRLNPGVSLAQFFAILAANPSSPDAADGFASIVVDAVVDKGTSSVQADLAPGQYVALDTAGNNPATWPHATFQIAPAASPAKLPAPQATIAAIDFGFRGPGVLHDRRRSPAHGWTLLFPETHPYAGGPDHYAAYLANTDAFEVELVATEPRPAH